MSTHVVAHHKNIVTAIAIVPVPVIDGKGDPTHVYVVTGSKARVRTGVWGRSLCATGMVRCK